MPWRPRPSAIGWRKSKRGGEYPPKLCEAIVKGLIKEKTNMVMVSTKKQEWVFAAVEDEDEGEDQGEADGPGLEEALDEEVEQAGQARGKRRRADLEEGEEVQPDEAEEEGAPQQVDRGVSEADKRLIRKLHINLGHPSREDFVRCSVGCQGQERKSGDMSRRSSIATCASPRRSLT